ncbi:roundabout-like 2-like [Silurus asotus]|uniref:Roundabout-like 2-like n=1 Tax=Silurus asotus TaxID=30991 RepID=A0AAD5FS70_SILAS|nr:roundabout-like 2-like [Silurus asotus]
MTFFHNVIEIDPTPPPVKAKATVSLGDHHFFSGQDVEMTCSVPDDPLASWTYEWFHEGKLESSSEVYQLKKARVLQSGNYTCKGQKAITDWPYTVETIPSDPLNIEVDGGWAILQTPYEPLVIQETATLTCRVRDGAFLSDAIFYKGEVEIQRQKGSNLVLSDLTLEDKGMYKCTAMWLANQEYQSSQSLPSLLNVLDKLETPQMKFVLGRSVVKRGTKVSFNCITKVNAREADLNLEYFYLKDGERLGPASAQDTYVISYVSKDDTGAYTCKVRIRSLNLERWSNKLTLRVL